MTAGLTPKEQAVLEAFLDRGGQATVLEIYEDLRDGYSRQTLYRTVSNLVRKGYLKVVGLKQPETPAGGRPEKVYTVLREPPQRRLPLPFFKETHDEVETKHLRDETAGRRETDGLTPAFGTYVEKDKDAFQQIAEGWIAGMHRPDLPQILRRAAELLAEEDPVGLYLSFADWIHNEYQKAARAYAEALRGQDHTVMTRQRRRMEDLRRLCDRVFTRGLGIPAEGNPDEEGRPRGPFRLQFDFQKCEDRSRYDREKVRRFLERGLVGRTVLEEITGEEAFPNVVAGTDTSRYEIRLYPTDQSALIFEPFPVSLINALYVRHDYKSKDLVDYDAEPEPAHWSQYSTEKAFDRGLLIPPLFYEEEPGMHARIREAAMDLRHYAKDIDALKADKGGVMTKVVLRDGRIFPLEHRFGDYIQATHHGRLVRRSLLEFLSLVTQMTALRRIYCGVVKQPVLGVFAPMVLWYLKHGARIRRGEGLWDDMSEEYIFGAPTSDRRIARVLLTTLEPPAPGRYRVTCRFVRPFYALTEFYHRYFKEHDGLLGEESPQDATIPSLTDVLTRRIGEGILDASEVDVGGFAWLCMNAAAASFFAVGPEGRYVEVIPKYEYLIPPDVYRSGPDAMRREDERIMRRLTPVLLHAEMLQEYPEDLDEEGRLRLPKPVCEAHELVKDLGRLFKNNVEEMLFRAAVRIARQKFHRPGSSFSPFPPQKPKGKFHGRQN